MFKENKFIIWGTYCQCGDECSILQNEHHPWDDTGFTVRLKCKSCDREVIIDRSFAEKFYNEKIQSYFASLYGNVVDLGCGGGFLSKYLIEQENINKVYGLDVNKECEDELIDLIEHNEKFQFINSDISSLGSIFNDMDIDFLVSRDVFMFIEDTDKYFDNVSEIVNKGIRQMGWYMDGNSRMKNRLLPEQIEEEYKKRGWITQLEYLDWYKCGYFISADKI